LSLHNAAAAPSANLWPCCASSCQETTVVRVLLVDDSAEVRRSLGRLLNQVPGVEVVGCADDLASAIDQVSQTQPDVVVLDVELRLHGRGMDVLRHVTCTHPQVQVIVLSNFTWQAMRAGFLQAGAVAYFDKSKEFTLARDWIASQVKGQQMSA
jgi:DNA-binding NarL/FixJ family response regulator